MKLFTIIIASTFLSLFIDCAHSPTQPTSKNSFDYIIKIPPPGPDSLHIILKITNSESLDSIRLLAPPIYADNPWIEPTASNFHNLSVTETTGSLVPFTTDSIMVGLYNSLSFSFSGADSLFTVEYDVTFHYIDTTNSPVPYLNTTSGYLKGSYLFVIPYDNTDLAAIWRTPITASVTYTTGNSVTLYGDPQPTVFFETPYELLFSTSAVNADVKAQGEVGNQEFRFVSLAEVDTINPLLIAKAKEDYRILLEDITTVFGCIRESPISIILGINNGGGLEGMYAFSILPPWENDNAGWFNMILAHETVHFWIGVRVGEFDDPWWKEGTTSYLGYLFALRNNLCSDYFITKKLLADLSSDEGVNRYALADPQVRNKIFAPIDNCESLVYNKGAQVTMLIDRRIREVSGGATSIDKILGDFVREYESKAFYREQYISFIEEFSGADISDIFDSHVITKGAIPDSILEDNCNALIHMGAFGDRSSRKCTIFRYQDSKPLHFSY